MPQSTEPTSDNSFDALAVQLDKERRTAFDYQKRRHEAWNEIYSLYRNRIQTNRLLQRNAVYIPLMKETIKTLLSKIDEPPTVEWKENDGDALKEIYVQAMWDADYDDFNYEGVDLQDKKTTLTSGRGHKKLNITEDGRVRVNAMDAFDIIVDPLTNPLDIETARFIIHQNIFRSLKEIMADERYSKEGKEQLHAFYTTESGLLQSDMNRKAFDEKMERLKLMGVSTDELLSQVGGDAVCNLAEHCTTVWNDKSEKWERHVITMADRKVKLLDQTLMEAIGMDMWPYVTWGEDVETMDYWSDSPGDLVLTPNKLVNIWFSQLVENRTLRNFQMHWYDATNENYQPQTYEPSPGKMLPAPGDPNKTIMPVNISGMDETMNAIDFITKIVERGTAATAIEKGTSERSQITLGEVKMLVGKAMERTISMAKSYRRSWRDLAVKWYLLTEANSDMRELRKLSSKGKIWRKTVYAKDWESDAGYTPYVRSSSEQDEEKTATIQRIQFLMSQFPNNRSLRRIGLRRMIDVATLTPEEIREITEEEKKNQESPELGSMLGTPPNVGQPEQGIEPVRPEPSMPVMPQA